MPQRRKAATQVPEHGSVESMPSCAAVVIGSVLVLAGLVAACWFGGSLFSFKKNAAEINDIDCPPGTVHTHSYIYMWHLGMSGHEQSVDRLYVDLCRYDPVQYNVMTYKRAPAMALNVTVSCPVNTTAVRAYYPSMARIEWNCGCATCRPWQALCPPGMIFNFTGMHLGPDIGTCINATDVDSPPLISQ